MQLVSLNKKIQVCGVILLILSLILNVVLVIVISKNKEQQLNQEYTDFVDNKDDYEKRQGTSSEKGETDKQDEMETVNQLYVVNFSKYNNDFSQSTLITIPQNIYVPQITMKNKDMETKVNANLEKAFLNWLPERINMCDNIEQTIHCSTDKYLSISYIYVQRAERIDNYYVANTINVFDGELVHLEDILEVDEELAELMLTVGIPKKNFDFVSGEYGTDYSETTLSKLSNDEVLQNLYACSEMYTTENWDAKPSFVLENERMYFFNVFGRESKFYVEYEDIAHKIKDKSLLGGE